jgi:hypothetical protein
MVSNPSRIATSNKQAWSRKNTPCTEPSCRLSTRPSVITRNRSTLDDGPSQTCGLPSIDDPQEVSKYLEAIWAVQTFSSNPPLLHGVGKRRRLIRTGYLLDNMLDDDKLEAYQSPQQL